MPPTILDQIDALRRAVASMGDDAGSIIGAHIDRLAEAPKIHVRADLFRRVFAGCAVTSNKSPESVHYTAKRAGVVWTCCEPIGEASTVVVMPMAAK